MEPNVVRKDEKNSSSVSRTGNNNFKLKGPRGWLHSIKNKVKGATKNLGEVLKKKLFKIIIMIVFAVIKVALPMILILSVCWWVVAGNANEESKSAVTSYVSSSSTISERAKTTYEEKNSTVCFSNNDMEKITESALSTMKKTNNKLYQQLSTEDMIGNHKISEISYASGLDISNAYEFVLNSERMNFNRITWKKYDRATGNVTDMELQTDSETSLKYPKTDEDDSKDLDFFVNMLMPYLQSNVIVTSMYSGISAQDVTEEIANFAFQIIDKGYHVIDVVQYVMQTAKRNQVVKHYVSKEYELKKYATEVIVGVEIDENGNAKVDENGNTIKITQTQYGYKKSELEEAKENAEKDYVDAVENDNELTVIERETDANVTKNFMYPVTKAYTLTKHMSAEYELKTYSDEDVESFKNQTYKMSVKDEKFLDVVFNEDDGVSYIDSADDSWTDTGETIKVKIENGEHITTTYVWNDELNETNLEERFYTADDVAEFVSEMDTTGTESSESTETSSGATVKASELFSVPENSYYSGLASDEDLTRIDFINAVPSIYNDYIRGDDNYSEYIGYPRSYLVASCALLKDSMPAGESSINYSQLLRQSLGTNLFMGQIIGENFIWPLPRDSGGRITECAGARVNPISGVYEESHGALDIGAVSGTEILAAQDGVVYSIEFGRSYGYNILLKHDSGGEYVYYTRYAHMNSSSATNGLGLKVGSVVKAGDVIGYVGSTGDSTGPHLHFELYQFKKDQSFFWTKDPQYRLDPLFYIQRDTFPENVLSQPANDSNWGCGYNNCHCSDQIKSEHFGMYAAVDNFEEESGTTTDNNSSSTTEESTSGSE